MSATQISTDGSGLNMSEIFAPFYWGFIISLFFGGITIVQAYIYFPHPTDRKHVQIIAATMLVLDLISSALIAQSLYYYLIPHYGSLAQLNSVTTELNVECLISTIITFISQMYFVFQIYTIKGLGRVARLLIIAITICAALAFVGGVGCVSAMIIFHHGVLANRNETFSIFFGLAKGFGTLTDLIATLAMCFFLSSSKTGISVQTNGLIKSLIQFAVNRGIVVTLIQTLLLILFYAAPNNLYWLAAHINVTKLYANTFFAMLNAREHIKQKYAGSKVVNSSLISNRYISSRLNEDRKFGTPHHDHAAESRDKSFEMPTVTKSLVVADL
ncbi:hypothetical protein Moror_12766 [Moniliophthora roreri MCA 2997]|uniref:DUF6534 domain-containing protein n=2 Tax=Moniliophthora roreri TaxID=221103 RepID=V2XRG5_MONRO|nr:hypothetical protein Moror_12766 [Moniliophthora roreri MCA 2997]